MKITEEKLRSIVKEVIAEKMTPSKTNEKVNKLNIDDAYNNLHDALVDVKYALEQHGDKRAFKEFKRWWNELDGFYPEPIVAEAYVTEDRYQNFKPKKVKFKIPAINIDAKVTSYIDTEAKDKNINIEIDTFEYNLREKLDEVMPKIMADIFNKAYSKEAAVEADHTDSYTGKSSGPMPLSFSFDIKK